MADLSQIHSKWILTLALLTAPTLLKAATFELTDAEVAHVQITLNNGEILSSQVAVAKARHSGVRDFAKTMITHHSENNSKVVAISRRLRMKPLINELSESILEQSKKQVDGLRNLRGASFDLAYVDQQIEAHEQALEVIDDELLTNAADEQVRNLIEQTRPTVVHHLDRAELLRASLEVEKK